MCETRNLGRRSNPTRSPIFEAYFYFFFFFTWLVLASVREAQLRLCVSFWSPIGRNLHSLNKNSPTSEKTSLIFFFIFKFG